MGPNSTITSSVTRLKRPTMLPSAQRDHEQPPAEERFTAGLCVLKIEGINAEEKLSSIREKKEGIKISQSHRQSHWEDLQYQEELHDLYLLGPEDYVSTAFPETRKLKHLFGNLWDRSNKKETWTAPKLACFEVALRAAIDEWETRIYFAAPSSYCTDEDLAMKYISDLRTILDQTTGKTPIPGDPLDAYKPIYPSSERAYLRPEQTYWPELPTDPAFNNHRPWIPEDLQQIWHTRDGSSFNCLFRNLGQNEYARNLAASQVRCTPEELVWKEPTISVETVATILDYLRENPRCTLNITGFKKKTLTKDEIVINELNRAFGLAKSISDFHFIGMDFTLGDEQDGESMNTSVPVPKEEQRARAHVAEMKKTADKEWFQKECMAWDGMAGVKARNKADNKAARRAARAASKEVNGKLEAINTRLKNIHVGDGLEPWEARYFAQQNAFEQKNAPQTVAVCLMNKGITKAMIPTDINKCSPAE